MPAVKLLIKFCGLGPITCISPRLVMLMLVCVIVCMYCIPTNRPLKNFVEPPSLTEHTRNARNFQCKAHILAFYLCFACIFGDVFELEKYFETLSQHLALLPFFLSGFDMKMDEKTRASCSTKGNLKCIDLAVLLCESRGS